MQSIGAGISKIFDSIIVEVNAGTIVVPVGRVCVTCLDTGFRSESRVGLDGRAYWGVTRVYDCCDYWQRRAEQRPISRKIDKG